MLAQDTLTGALYEVPEHLGSPYGEVHYDGLGFPILGNLLKSVVGKLPGIGNIVGGLFGGGAATGGAAPVPQIPGLSNIMSMFGGGGGGIPGLSNIMSMFGGGGGGMSGLSGYGDVGGFGFPFLPGLFPRLFGGQPSPPRPPFPFPFLRPPGWIPRPTPYTGMPPRRMYMRCAVWPYRAGLVPAWAAQAQPGAPGVPLPGQIPGALPAAAVPGGGRRRGRFRRRRR